MAVGTLDQFHIRYNGKRTNGKTLTQTSMGKDQATAENLLIARIKLQIVANIKRVSLSARLSQPLLVPNGTVGDNDRAVFTLHSNTLDMNKTEQIANVSIATYLLVGGTNGAINTAHADIVAFVAAYNAAQTAAQGTDWTLVSAHFGN